MNVLLVEPDYRRNSRSIRERNTTKKRADESLWYPPIGLMKLSRFHKDRGDKVKFVYGCVEKRGLFDITESWDRIYITTLFTYHWEKIIETINFYKEFVWGDTSKIFVGGVMASLFPKDLKKKTGVRVISGVLYSPEKIDLPGERNIDRLPPDYSILDKRLYAINDTYYAYTSRGCINNCSWCGVPKIEKRFVPYINIKGTINKLRREYGDKPKLKLMDNNVLASPYLKNIVNDLIKLGYGKNSYTNNEQHKRRVLDFNQGLDASFITEENMKLLADLNIEPMRIAFDRIGEEEEYINAVEIAEKNGVKSFSNYMLYNFADSPKDLYERLMVNIEFNEKWRKGSKSKANIYSYPMRYAPIDSTDSPTVISQENGLGIPQKAKEGSEGSYNGVLWTKRFTRNIEVMKGVAHGSISPTPSLAKRTIGETYDEFLANLYMPEELLRNRNKYEKKIYKHEPKRKKGTGDVEKFRSFIYKLLNKKDNRFLEFHNVVSKNRKQEIRNYSEKCKDKKIKKWLNFYIK